MPENIYIIGFMASGKSTVGRLLAKALKRRFVDMDEELEKKFRAPIREVFETRGEQFFRDKETALLQTLARRSRLVVAAGGGAADRDGNRGIMKESGLMVSLEADLPTLKARLDPTEIAARPMWKDQAFVEELFRRRSSIYAKAGLRISVDSKAPDRVAEEIVAAITPEEEFSAALDGADCPVVCTWDAPRAVAKTVGDRRAVVLTDRNVERLCLDRFRDALKDPLVVAVSPGDRNKTMRTAQSVYETLLAARYDRGDVLVGLGGGMVTDLAAFVASTYKRGMGFVLCSTTLVGHVDAAVGGKAAVNLGRAKNIVGSFTVPDRVVLDLTALRTLGPAHITEGMVEAYKTGLVAAPELAELVELDSRALAAGDQPLLARVASLSARTKADVVSRDFRESGLRRILNFGHTFGHAVEGFHEFRVSHGSAVAVGMIAATIMSGSRGLLDPQASDRIIRTVRSISPRRVALPPLDAAWEIMLHDKKIRRGRMVFVLLEDVGRPVCVEDVSRDELARALSEMRETDG